MKKIALSLLLLLGVSCGAVHAADIQWYTNYDQAEAAAKDQNKPILLFFTGSDWCGWCMKLKKEVFDKPEFAKLAGDKYIFVDVDFPMRGSQSTAIKQQNERLAAKYSVDGYPTVILLSSTGKKLGQTGYQKGGPKKYADHLQGFLSRAPEASERAGQLVKLSSLSSADLSARALELGRSVHAGKVS